MGEPLSVMMNLQLFHLNIGFYGCGTIRYQFAWYGRDSHNAGTSSATTDPLGMLRQVVGVDAAVLGSETPLAPEDVGSAPGLAQ